MKTILTFFLVLFCVVSRAQNLYISLGGYLSLSHAVAMNDHISDPLTSTGPVQIPEKFNKASFHPEFINILFEINLDTHLSLKTGINIHSNKGSWTEIFYDRSVHGNWSWRDHSFTDGFSITEFDFPILISYNIMKGDHKFGVKNLNIGPYFGYIFKGTDDLTLIFPAYLQRFNFGCNISAGFGTENWQFSIYILKGIRNLYKQNVYYPNLQRVTPNVLGINLTRIIHFSK
jgi:hypothetical protein